MLASRARQTVADAVRDVVDARATVETVHLAGVAPLRVADAVDTLREAEVTIANERCKQHPLPVEFHFRLKEQQKLP